MVNISLEDDYLAEGCRTGKVLWEWDVEDGVLYVPCVRTEEDPLPFAACVLPDRDLNNIYENLCVDFYHYVNNVHAHLNRENNWFRSVRDVEIPLDVSEFLRHFILGEYDFKFRVMEYVKFVLGDEASKTKSGDQDTLPGKLFRDKYQTHALLYIPQFDMGQNQIPCACVSEELVVDFDENVAEVQAALRGENVKINRDLRFVRDVEIPSQLTEFLKHYLTGKHLHKSMAEKVIRFIYEGMQLELFKDIVGV